MPSLLIEKAISIIDNAPESGPLKDPVAYANALPDDDAASLKHVLRSQEIETISREYELADASADRAQHRFNWIAWSAAYAGFLAALLGGLLFYMNSLSAAKEIENVAWAAQYVCLGISSAAALALSWLKPFDTWRKQRSAAESKRRGLYERIVIAPTPEGAPADALLLPLKLECIRRHLVEGQRDWFRSRGGDFRRMVRRWTVGRVLATFLIVGAGIPLLTHIVLLPWMPDWLRDIFALIPVQGDAARKSYWFAGLVGGFLQGFLASASSISLAERNSATYAAMAKLLDNYLDASLAVARQHAAEGDQDAVTTYVTGVVLAELAREANDWDAWHKARSEMALKLLGRPNVAPPGGG